MSHHFAMPDSEHWRCKFDSNAEDVRRGGLDLITRGGQYLEASGNAKGRERAQAPFTWCPDGVATLRQITQAQSIMDARHDAPQFHIQRRTVPVVGTSLGSAQILPAQSVRCMARRAPTAGTWPMDPRTTPRLDSAPMCGMVRWVWGQKETQQGTLGPSSCLCLVSQVARQTHWGEMRDGRKGPSLCRLVMARGMTRRHVRPT